MPKYKKYTHKSLEYLKNISHIKSMLKEKKISTMLMTDSHVIP